MNSVATALGALGGVVVFIGGLYALVRGIFRQINATEANTATLKEIRDELRVFNSRFDDHEKRISWLEGALK